MLQIEPLERRQLLSAVLENRILTVTGTGGADLINLWNSGKKPTQLVVNDGSQEFSFARRSIRLVRINGGRGDDQIRALVVSGQVDLPLSINAGAGSDLVTAGAGADSIIGETGSDTINGGGGADFVDYRYVDAPSRLPGDRLQRDLGLMASLGGSNTFEPGGFIDSLNPGLEGVIGTSFNDQITGNDGANTIIAGEGRDTIGGGAGDDLLDGGSGNDTIFGGEDNDTLIGNVGNDRFIGEAGNDDLLGGDGTDSADYSYRQDSTGAVTATIGGIASGDGIGTDTIENDVEAIVGTNHPDSLTGNNKANILTGNGGNDTIFGAGGQDQITGGAGADSFHTSEKDLVTDFEQGTDVLV